MKTRSLLFTFLAPLLLTVTTSAMAGWVEVDMEGNRTFFSEGKIKDVADGESTWSVFDTTTGTLMMVDDELGIYTSAEVDDYCQAIFSATEEALEQMSPEERELMEQLMGGGQEPGAEAPRLQVAVESLGEGESIAGYATETYRILVNGLPYQDLWIAPDAPVMEEIDISGLQSYQREMSTCLEAATPWTMGPAPETSPDYEEVLRKGWVMRSIQYDGTGEIVSRNEIAQLEEDEISATEFEEPAGYRQVGVRDFMESRN
jgi:hypothetical protein